MSKNKNTQPTPNTYRGGLTVQELMRQGYSPEAALKHPTNWKNIKEREPAETETASELSTTISLDGKELRISGKEALAIVELATRQAELGNMALDAFGVVMLPQEAEAGRDPLHNQDYVPERRV